MRLILCLVILFYFATCDAQRRLVLYSNSKENQNLLNTLEYNKEITDSLSVYQEADKILAQLQFRGYFLAEIEAITFNNQSVSINLKEGKPFKWLHLSSGNLPKEIFSAIGFREKDYINPNLDVEKLQQLLKSILIFYEDNGYPFASVGLDSVDIRPGGVFASIKVNQNHKIVYDAIKIVGNAQIGQKYLQSYLNMKQNYPYAERVIAQVDNRLREIPFLSVAKPSEIGFSAEKASLTVFASKRNANQFDGILGLQQEPITGKLQIVGNVKLSLQNALKLGEKFGLDYQGLPNSSQLLDAKIVVPHIFNTAFGFAPSLYIYKQDTSFLNINTKIGFNYLLSRSNLFQLFIENRVSNLTAVDAYRNITELPNILDASTFFYGIAFNFENLDYRYNPQKGIDVNVDFSVGSKKIRKNSAIDESLYAGIPLLSTSYRFYARIKYFKSLAKQVVLAMGSESALLGGKFLSDNELFRLGGQQGLRGFNELSILATKYSFSNAELRYLLAQHSFLFAFYNQAYVNYKTEKLNFKDYPLGFGAGINLETDLGILSVSYALGKQRNNPLNLRQGKIHFGITALF